MKWGSWKKADQIQALIKWLQDFHKRSLETFNTGIGFQRKYCSLLFDRTPGNAVSSAGDLRQEKSFFPLLSPSLVQVLRHQKVCCSLGLLWRAFQMNCLSGSSGPKNALRATDFYTQEKLFLAWACTGTHKKKETWKTNKAAKHWLEAFAERVWFRWSCLQWCSALAGYQEAISSSVGSLPGLNRHSNVLCNSVSRK